MTGVVVDTSAVVAILLGEPDADDLLSILAAAGPRLLSAATLVELGIVLEARLGSEATGIAGRFVRDSGIDVVALDRPQADRSLEGWRRFGKGRHPAGLNLGDCYAYGLAATTGYPVLCVGSDFARTDVGVLPDPDADDA
ncbi:MAG: type II toxin-antitoxin system VapC family toxin [Acidimicrobiales bacterium]